MGLLEFIWDRLESAGCTWFGLNVDGMLGNLRKELSVNSTDSSSQIVGFGR